LTLLASALSLTAADSGKEGLRLEQLARIKPAAKLLHRLSKQLDKAARELKEIPFEEAQVGLAKARNLVFHVQTLVETSHWPVALSGEMEAALEQALELADRTLESEDGSQWPTQRDVLVDKLQTLAILLAYV
jgi:hypothetical protein